MPQTQQRIQRKPAKRTTEEPDTATQPSKAHPRTDHATKTSHRATATLRAIDRALGTQP